MGSKPNKVNHFPSGNFDCFKNKSSSAIENGYCCPRMADISCINCNKQITYSARACIFKPECEKCLIPVAQRLEHSVCNREFVVQVPPGVSHFPSQNILIVRRKTPQLLSAHLLKQCISTYFPQCLGPLLLTWINCNLSKLNHVSKRGPWVLASPSAIMALFMQGKLVHVFHNHGF